MIVRKKMERIRPHALQEHPRRQAQPHHAQGVVEPSDERQHPGHQDVVETPAIPPGVRERAEQHGMRHDRRQQAAVLEQLIPRAPQRGRGRDDHARLSRDKNHVPRKGLPREAQVVQQNQDDEKDKENGDYRLYGGKFAAGVLEVLELLQAGKCGDYQSAERCTGI